MIAKTQLIISKTHFDPFKVNTIFRKGNLSNKAVYNLNSLQFLQQVETDLLNKVEDKENFLVKELQEKILNRYRRVRILDNIYFLFDDINCEFTDKNIIYPYLKEIKISLESADDINFTLVDLKNIDKIHAVLNFIYQKCNKAMNEFYVRKIVSINNAKQQILMKYIKKKNKKKNKYRVEEEEENDISHYTINTFAAKMISELVVYFPVNENSKQGINFIQFLKMFLDQDTSLLRVISIYQKASSSITSATYYVEKQVNQYVDQIGIYLYFLKYLQKESNIDIGALINSYKMYEIIYETKKESNVISANVKISELKFITIDIDSIRSEEDLCKVSVKDLNRFIAFLVQMEKYFFSVLEYTYLLTIDNETNISKE